jgi:UDP-N-acetylglucosamine--N-acetylmuramyl-(pentapeptide) pyrophosphoryl-undecaprenol N-acetylglucosamine transferase
MKLLIAAGGTGGHVFPGLAVAEALMELDSKSEPVFVGTSAGLESKVIPQAGFRMHFIKAHQFTGRNLAYKARTLAGLVSGIGTAMGIMGRERPDAVLGMGGFTSVPAVLGAVFKGIPAFIHEQNVEPGLANRLLSRMVKGVFVSFKESASALPCRVRQHTGNPLRRALRESRGEKKEKDFGVFVFGGSRGARSINEAVLALLPFMAGYRNVTMYHQTGVDDYERVLRAYNTTSLQHEVFPFTEEMAKYYRLSDVVISRAGATTIFELACFRKPAVLIPYPYSAGQHQWKNASYVESLGGAHVIPNHEASGERLHGVLQRLMDRPELLGEMADRIATIYIEDAAERIVKGITDGISQD